MPTVGCVILFIGVAEYILCSFSEAFEFALSATMDGVRVSVDVAGIDGAEFDTNTDTYGDG